jgi:hypothetical protein
MRDHGEAFLPVAVEAERFARGIRRSVAIKRCNVRRSCAPRKARNSHGGVFPLPFARLR